MMLHDLGQRVTKQQLKWLIDALTEDIMLNVSMIGIISSDEIVTADKLISRIIHYKTQYTYSVDDLKMWENDQEMWLAKLELLQRLEKWYKIK